MTYDLTIIGGGPAGVAAGVYASRKRLKTAFVTESFAGQSAVSEGIENWIGTIKISGQALSDSLEAHLRAYAGDIVDIKLGKRVISIKNISPKADTRQGEQTTQANANSETLFEVAIGSEKGEVSETITSKTILIATGSTRRKLPAKGADTFDNKGLTYCATCDGPLFTGQDVVVVGGGNAAFESAAQLSAYCKTVYIMNRSSEFRADPVTVEKVLAKANVKPLINSEIVEVKGDKSVNAITYKTYAADAPKDDSKAVMTDLPVGGVFVEIGLIPTTAFVKDVVTLDAIGKIITDPRSQKTQTPGIWAAGDCTDGLYHQNNIAAGDAVKALEDIYATLHTK